MLKAGNNSASLAARLIAAACRSNVKISYADDVKLQPSYESSSSGKLSDPISIYRAIAHGSTLLGITHEQISTIENYLDFSSKPIQTPDLEKLNAHLLIHTFIADPQLTIADFAVFSALYPVVSSFKSAEGYPNLIRWFNHIQNLPVVRSLPLAPLPQLAPPPSPIYSTSVTFEPSSRSTTSSTSSSTTSTSKSSDSKSDNQNKKEKSSKEESKPAANQQNNKNKGNEAESSSSSSSSSSSKDKKEKKEKPAAPAKVEIPSIYRAELRVGVVVSASPHPTESKMLVLKVDVGGAAPLDVVSGIGGYYTPAQINGHRLILWTNLKPGNVKDVMSSGRVFVATSEDGTSKEVVLPPVSAKIGEKVRFLGVPDDKAPDQPVASKHVSELLKHFRVVNNIVQWNGITFETSAGPVSTTRIANGTVA